MPVKQFLNNPFQENTYIVWDEPTLEAAIIDCGALTDNERNDIENFIENHRLVVRHIINTHLHLDHCFGVAWACMKYGLTLEASSADSSLLHSLRQQAELFGIPSSLIDLATDTLKISPLCDGDTLPLGQSSLSVIATPGHTLGGLCFYDKQNAILFSGDTLFNGSVGRTDLEGGSYSALINSIRQKLVILPDNVTIYCGHGPYTTIADEKQYNPYL